MTLKTREDFKNSPFGGGQRGRTLKIVVYESNLEGCD